MIRRFAVASVLVIAISAVAAGCGQDAALVGGECAAGLTECNLRCVDLTRDTSNCGACGHACDPGVACVAGACATAPFSVDATINGPSSDDGGGNVDGTTSDAPTIDGGTGDGATNDGATTDASIGDADAGVAPDGAACVPPYDTIYQCGTCQTACVAPDDVCKPVGDGTYVCGQLCTAPLVNCGGACVDKTNDPSNCGACGKVCPSNLCIGSVCQGSTPGDVVLVGHDYATTAAATAQGTVLANAVFIPATNPLRVLSYERYADVTAVQNAKKIVGVRAASLNRTVAYTVSVADGDVPSKLSPSAFDVLVVHDQKAAAAGALGALGDSWAATLAAFDKAGGVIVVLDGDVGVAEMPQFVTSAGLLQVASHAPLASGSAVTVTAPSDDVGVGVLSPYGVWSHSATFTLADLTNVTVVVRAGNGSGSPVVAHRIVP